MVTLRKIKKSKKKKFKSETDLGEVVVNWLQKEGWTIFQEVEHSNGVIDIVAKANNIVWTIECKNSWNGDVFEQAQKHLHRAHYSSVAVPASSSSKEPASHRISEFFCCQKGIGILQVKPPSFEGDEGVVRETLSPKLCRNTRRVKSRYVKRLKESLKRAHPDNKAGMASHQRITPFKITIESIHKYLKLRNRWIDIKQIIEGVTHHYASANSAKSSLIKALTSYAGDGLEYKYENGIWYFKKVREKI